MQSPKSVVLHCCRVIQVSGSFGAFGRQVWKKSPVLLETSNRCCGRGRGRIALNVSQAVCIGVVSITRLKPENPQKNKMKNPRRPSAWLARVTLTHTVLSRGVYLKLVRRTNDKNAVDSYGMLARVVFSRRSVMLTFMFCWGSLPTLFKAMIACLEPALAACCKADVDTPLCCEEPDGGATCWALT